MVLYNRKCSRCGKSMVAMYHPSSPYTIYCSDCWSSDAWDPTQYGQAYDSGRPFFDQLNELLKRVPKAGIYASPDVGPNINSEYTNFAGGNKDCYLIFNSGPQNENCAYSRGIMNIRDGFDSYFCDVSERMYEGVNVQKSNAVVWVQNTAECLNSWFLLNCVGCSNCFGCVNLRHKSYHWFNEELSKEEWARRMKEVAGSYAKLEDARKKFEKFALKFPRRENNNLRSVNCTGDYIFDSKDCNASFEIASSENLGYCFFIKLAKDCYDLIGHGRKSDLLLEGVATGTSSRVIGSWWTMLSHDVEYSWALRAGEYCFGCDSLRSGKYMILNKQYSEEEYKKIREQIIAELKSKNLYGLFIPPSLAPFAYNETIAQDNLTMKKEEAIAQGFRWQDDLQMTMGKETMKSEAIPDNIKDVPDSITKEVLVCITCGRNYRLIQPEVTFYKKMEISIPRQCFFCRHRNRLARRGPMKLFDRGCAKCKKPIKTNFAPDRPEIVYCENCYQNEVI